MGTQEEYSTVISPETQAFLKPLNIWCTAILYYHCYSSVWRTRNVWWVGHMLLRTPYWWL
jgi:hypothetical protein